MKAPPSSAHRNQRRGSAIVEFTLAGTFMFLPILAGLATVGISIVTGMQVANLNANAGQMFASGVDFTQSGNQNILMTIAGNLNSSTTGFDGVVVLSEVDISASGPVTAQQVVVGNASYEGNVPDVNNPSAQVGAAMLAADMALAAQSGQTQTAYVAETYLNNSKYAWVFGGASGGTGIYMKNIF